jgi:hypothetical protein
VIILMTPRLFLIEEERRGRRIKRDVWFVWWHLGIGLLLGFVDMSSVYVPFASSLPHIQSGSTGNSFEMMVTDD